MDELLTGFTLGNAAILTNVCLLPLYPGLIAFLAGNASGSERKAATGWFGALVLAGILTMMLLVALVIYLLQVSFGAVLTGLLPVIYGLVLLLGLLMLTGRNPFAQLTTVQAPILKNPYATAYVYGLLLGPMTLPCTGPLIVTQFALGVGSTTELINGMLYFLAFGLGFGWPLLILPLFAVAAQRRFTGWLTQHYTTLTRVSGLLLVLIAVYGFYTEFVTNAVV